MKTAKNEIRAYYTEKTIRVYQAYSNSIADIALDNKKFISPPFKMERMTWIKPSFLWMMYRSGWGFKDANQSRILAIDISRTGFEWALSHGCLSHPSQNENKEEWKKTKNDSPVRIQWDPERDIRLNRKEQRTIQIGLSQQAVDLFVNHWTENIIDLTSLAHKIYEHIKKSEIDEARNLLPLENTYPASDSFSHIF